jgi:hypothetical protein
MIVVPHRQFGIGNQIKPSLLSRKEFIVAPLNLLKDAAAEIVWTLTKCRQHPSAGADISIVGSPEVAS